MARHGDHIDELAAANAFLGVLRGLSRPEAPLAHSLKYGIDPAGTTCGRGEAVSLAA